MDCFKIYTDCARCAYWRIISSAIADWHGWQNGFASFQSWGSTPSAPRRVISKGKASPICTNKNSNARVCNFYFDFTDEITFVPTK